MAATSKAIAQQITIPPSYVCSITGQIMADPVFTDDGQTYERGAIEEWLKEHDTSPKTGKKLDDKRLRSNWDKKGDISEFLIKHPELYDGDEIYLPKSWKSELIAAIKANKTKEVQELLTKDKRLLTMKLEGEYTAFHLAAQFGSSELTNILLENLIKRNALDKLPKLFADFKPIYLNGLLEKSLIKEDKSKCSLLLKLGAELNQLEEGTQNTLLHKLAIQGKSESVKWLLEKGLSIEAQNIEGNTPLLLAVLHGQVEMVELLLNNGANPKAKNNQKQNAISIALVQQNKPLLNLLVGIEKAALPFLHLALTLNDVEVLKVLLKQNPGKDSLEALDARGQTPFYALIAKNSKDMKEKEETVRLLLAAGADVMVACGTEKLTALHLAASQGDLGMLKLLLTTKAATLMDAKDSQGNTALHLAAKAGQDELVTYLLEVGADHEARNEQGQTPIELARAQDKASTAAIIVQKVRAIKQAQTEEIRSLRELVQKQKSRIEQLENEMAKLKQKVGPEEDTKERSERVESSTSLTLQFQAQLKSTQSKPDLKVSAEEIQKFLNHVVAGEQPKAEEMLKQKPELVLATGTVTDHAKRTFKNITGFQYAVWALDWQMWRVIKSYLSKEAAEEQARGFAEGSWVKEYEEHADWKKLIEAQQTLIDNFQSWDWKKVEEYWVQQIGGAQLLLPMHVLQEYNQPGRPFYPCPKFDTDYALNRARCDYEVAKLGGKESGFGIIRGAREALFKVSDYTLIKLWQHGMAQDRVALAQMMVSRTQQRAALVAELAEKPSVSPSK